MENGPPGEAECGGGRPGGSVNGRACAGGPGRELENVWAGIVALYERRPATGRAGAELVGLAFAAEDLIGRDPEAAAGALDRAAALLEDLGVPHQAVGRRQA